MNVTLYRLPIEPSPCEFCGVDEQGSLYFHPAAINDELLRKANQVRATVFVRIQEGLVPLVSFDWAENVLAEYELHLLDILKGACLGFMKGAQTHHCSCADVFMPGDPAFTDAVLRALAGDKN